MNRLPADSVRIQDVADGISLYRYIGVVIDVEGDVVRCAVPLTANNTNHIGSMHAGVTFSTIEMVGGMAIMARPELADDWLVVRRVEITYNKVARTAVRAETTLDDDLVGHVLG